MVGRRASTSAVMPPLTGPSKGPGGPSFFGIPAKQASLIALTFQNSALILIMHYSRRMQPPGDHRYFTSTAVLLNEVLKLAISLTFALHEVSRSLAPQTPVTVLFEQIYNAVFKGDGWKLAIPAMLYTLENTLQYVALGNLDAVHFQILFQLKILTTAFFSVILLGRTLGIKRWISLVVLTLGVSVVSLPSTDPNEQFLTIHDFSDHFFPRSMHELGHSAANIADAAIHLTRRGLTGLGSELTRRSATYEGIQDDLQGHVPSMNYSVGVTAVLVSAVVSGLTGVYFEKVIKDSASTPHVSVWIRNIQLSFYSLFPALIFGVIMNDGAEIAKHGFFDGYNAFVWATIVLQASGGVLTSICINYADNIAKNFATSISIVVSFVFSVWFFELAITPSIILGTALVIGSTYLYSLPENRKRGARPPPISIVSYEKTTIDSTPKIDQSKLLNPLDAAGVGLATSRPTSPLLFRDGPSSRGSRRGDH